MITRLSIQGFRGITGRVDLEFARVTLLTGRNGLGKTTIFDALDWCLFGPAWRLAEAGAIRNLYSRALSPKVSLTLSLDRDYIIERDELGVRIDGVSVSDRDLVQTFVQDPDVFGPYSRDVEARVRRLVYLPQAEIRDLVKPAAESERVALLHNILGVPNAAVTEKSIRRVKERLAQRGSDALSRLEALRADISDVGSRGSGIYDHGGLDRDGEISYAKNILGPASAAIDSVDGLLALSLAALEQLRNRKARFIEFQAWLAEVGERRTILEASLADTRQLLGVLEAELQQRSSALGEVRERRERARVTVSAARERLASLTGRLDRARRLLARLSAVEQTETAIAQITTELATAEVALRRAGDEADAEERSVHNGRLQLTELQERFEAWQTTSARIGEYQDLERQSQGVQRELSSIRQAIADLDRQLQGSEGELLGLNQRKRSLDAQYRLILTSMPAADRLASLLADLAQTMAQLGLTACPLCGAPYQNGEDLLQHVRETSSRRALDAQAIEQLSNEINALEARLANGESDRLVARGTHTDLLRKERERAIAFRRLGARLVELQPLEELASHDRAGEGLQAALEGSRRSIEERSRRLAAARTEEGRQQLRVEQLRGDLLLREARAADAREGFDARDPHEARLAALNEIGELEVEHARIAGMVQTGEDAEQAVSVEVAELERRGAQSDRDVIESRSLLAGDIERLRGLNADLVARAHEVGFERTGAVDSSLRRSLAEVDTQERELRRVITAMDSLATIQEQDERRSQLVALRAREEEVKSRVDELSRAALRFDVIAAAIQARAETEARDALLHQTNAIQEALIALLPHHHLNRVLWDERTGSILLSDRLLASAVRPDLYTSTGQMNVLALAVFLGVALLQRITAFDFLALDEPVQNLDDVHFLAFVTLVKRVAGSRQVILSTADRNFAEVLRRQMKGSAERRGYAQYEWREFRAGVGPDIVKVESRVSTSARSTTTIEP